MSVFWLVLGLALSGAAGAVIAFAWAVRSGQLDDTDTPALRILFDDDAAPTGDHAAHAATRGASAAND